MRRRSEEKITRLKKDELLARLGPLDDARLRQLICEVYRGGPDTVRARIEDAFNPQAAATRVAPEDVGGTLDAVRAFLDLVHGDAFLYGREVSPKRKAQWRHEYRKMFEDLVRLLSSPAGERAAGLLEEAIELSVSVNDHTHFRSEDPNEAAKVVVSDQVEALWSYVALRQGVPALLERALPQLWAWEQRYGWTRGFGSVGQRERSLAKVLAARLTVRPAWESAAMAWKRLLDEKQAGEASPTPVAGGNQPRAPTRGQREYSETERRHRRDRRAMNLEPWHALLAERLGGDDPLVTAVLDHPSIDSPYTWWVKARVAAEKKDFVSLRALIERAMERLPGFDEMVLVGLRAGVELPPAAEALAVERKLRKRLAELEKAGVEV